MPLCSRRERTSFRRSLPSFFLFSLPRVSSPPAAASLFSLPTVFPPSLCGRFSFLFSSPPDLRESLSTQLDLPSFLPSFLSLLRAPPTSSSSTSSILPVYRGQLRGNKAVKAAVSGPLELGNELVKRRVLTRGVYFFLWEATQS